MDRVGRYRESWWFQTKNKTKHNCPHTEVLDFFPPGIKMQPVDKRMISSVIEEKNQGKNNRNNIRIL